MADVFFPDYVTEQLTTFGAVTTRPMFGGNGIYKSGMMFAVIFDGELYFKVDDNNRADFTAKKSKPFVYQAKGRTITLSYWYVPEDVLEETDVLCAWAEKAYAAALAKRKDDNTQPKSRRRALGQPQQRRRR